MRKISAIAGILSLLLVSGCAGISFTKAGESEAITACRALSGIQGDDVTLEEFMSAVAKAQVYASRAARENSSYNLLDSAMQALGEVLFTGSEDLAQSAWANAANLCRDL